MHKKSIAVSLVVALFLLIAPAPALADGVFMPASVLSDITEPAQKAIIISTNATGNYAGNYTGGNYTGGSYTGKYTEHLILSATFKAVKGDAKNFAWVVPVPSKPDMTVASPELFDELSYLTATGGNVGGGGFGCFGYAGGGGGGTGGVDVISQQVVGIYATAILSATNATALVDWLNANGYVFPENGEEVVNQYIEKQWYFVATKINAVKEGTSQALDAGAIEPIVFTFATNETVYPLNISSLSATTTTAPEVLLYVIADHVMVPEDYPLDIGYGNWEENAFTLEYAHTVSVESLYQTSCPELAKFLSACLSSNSIADEFYLTKLRGRISADHMADINMVSYEKGGSAYSLAVNSANNDGIFILALLVGPAFGLNLWRRRRKTPTSRGPEQ
jgi:hypothetical protein